MIIASTNMSRIENIYKQLGEDLPSADFDLDSSEEEDIDKPEITNYKPQNSDDYSEMVDVQLSSKIAGVSDYQPLEENLPTHYTHNYVMVLSEEDEYKASCIKERTVVSAASTDTVMPVELCSKHTSDEILSMEKLEDIENFMDTLLDSKLEENSLDDSTQNVPHEAELSTAKPLTDVQLMGELYKLNDKLSLTPEHKSSTDSNGNKEDSNEAVEKRSNVGFDSSVGSIQDSSSTIFIDLRPQKPEPTNQLSTLTLSSTAKKLLTDRIFPSCSSTNDSGDDSGEEDLIWSSYRKQMKSQSLNSSTDTLEDLNAFLPSSEQHQSNITEPTKVVQSWSQMLQSVTPSVQSNVMVSSSSELDDTMVAGDVLPSNGSQNEPITVTVSKVGKKAKVQKHAKKKRKAQANKDEKKGETSKSKQKGRTEEQVQDFIADTEKQVQDSKLCNEVNLDDSNGNKPDDKVKLVQYQDQSEDINKIKIRLEAQISARRGFSVLPLVYDKDATYEPVLCQTSSSATTNGLLTVELDSNGLPIVDNLQFDAELSMLKTTKSWLIALFVMLATKDTNNKAINSVPFIVTGLKQTVFDGKAAIVVAISTVTGKENNSTALHNVNKWLNDTTLEQLAEAASTEVPSVISELVCDEDSLIALPLSDILSFTENSSSFFMPASFYWERFDKDNGTTGDTISCDVETTVATINHTWLSDAIFFFSVLDSITSAGLDLAGLRLAWEPENGHPLVALAIRGPYAITRWAEVVGPGDHELAKVTDPTSLSALFGKPETDLMWFSRNAHRAFYATAKWFGGRACTKTKTVFGINDAATKAEKRKWQKVRFADSPKSESTESSTPTTPTITSCLFAANYSKIILTVSPKLPPLLYPLVFSACNQTGYKIFGIKRMRLNQKRARMLSLSSDDKMDNFTPSSPSIHQKESPVFPLSPLCENAPPMPSLLLILSRENALYHSSVLSTCLQEKLSPHFTSKSSLLLELRIAPYSDMVLSTIKSFTETPSKPYFSLSKMSSMKGSVKDMVQLKEELSIVCFFENQVQNLVTGLEILFHICSNSTSEDPIDFKLEFNQKENNKDRGKLLGPFELLGLKWLPKAEKHTLQDVKVFENYIECFKDGDVITNLMMQSFVVVVFRGIDANNRIKQLLAESSSFRNSSIAMSSTAFAGIQLASLLFASRELFSDFEARHLSLYSSPEHLMNANMFQSMEESNTNICASILAVKVDAFNLFVKILEKLCRHGFRIVGLKIAEVTDEKWLNMKSASKRTTYTSQLFRCFVICFEYVNAVWYLEYEVFPYVCGNQAILNSVYWSHSYLLATRDVQFFFPNGLCCIQNGFTESNKIFCPAIDMISCQKEVQECNSDNDSPLTESNCIIVPSKIVLNNDYSLASDLECLVALKFTIVCLEAVYFSQEMTKRILSVLSLSRKEDHFIAGTSILIVVKRDNAASCFQSIVQPSDFSKNVVVPKSSNEASKLLNLLFHDKQ